MTQMDSIEITDRQDATVGPWTGMTAHRLFVGSADKLLPTHNGANWFSTEHGLKQVSGA